MRVASRAANTLRAGYPIARYEDLEHCTVILIAAPPERAIEFVEELRKSEVDLSQKSVIVTGSNLDSSVLEGLTERGAAIGSLHMIELPSGPLCLVEGQDRATKAVQAIVGSGNTRSVRIRDGHMSECFAALCLTSHCFLPLIDACVEGFVQAGVEAGDAGEMASRLLLRSIRAYGKAGRQAWNPVRRDFMLDKVAKIELKNKRLAGYYSSMFDLADRWMTR